MHSIQSKTGGRWLAGCTPVSPRTRMRNICVLCTFSSGMLTCQPQHQPSAFPTPGSQRGHNRLPTDNGPKQHCCWQWSDFVETISAADCPMTEPPLPVLPCSHTAQCSVHRGLCCPASYSHAIPLAAAARAPLEQTSSKHAAFSEEQMPYQPFNFTRSLTVLLHFSLRSSSSVVSLQHFLLHQSLVCR